MNTHLLQGLKTSLIFLIVTTLGLCACVKRPVYAPPPDPFNVSHFQYRAAEPVIQEANIKSVDTTRWYEAGKQDSDKLREALETLRVLVKAYHVPSMDLLGTNALSQCIGFFGSGGFNGKFKKHYQKALREHKVSRSHLIDSFKKSCKAGIGLVIQAARYGYQPAIDRLTKLDIKLPHADLKAPALAQAEAEYEQQLTKYNKQQDQIALVVGALAGAAAAGAQAYADANSAGPSYGASSGTMALLPPSSGSTFDPQSGNQYYWRKDSRGNTHVDGSNLATGSIWNHTIKPNGGMDGTDSKGNYWTYDDQTGNYFNFGTGKSCFGKGELKTCF